jgi:hypothetical protein
MWYEIGKFLVFKNFNLSSVSKSFRQPFLFMLRSSIVSINLVSNSLQVLQTYGWCIDELHWNSKKCILSKLIFPRLQSLYIFDTNDTRLQSKMEPNLYIKLTQLQFPKLKHLSITHFDKINLYSLDLVSLYIDGNMDSSQIHGMKSIQLLHFSSYFSINGMISLLQTLPNLKFLQIQDGETSDILHKLFKNVHVDKDFDNFETRWNEELNKIYNSS